MKYNDMFGGATKYDYNENGLTIKREPDTYRFLGVWSVEVNDRRYFVSLSDTKIFQISLNGMIVFNKKLIADAITLGQIAQVVRQLDARVKK